MLRPLMPRSIARVLLPVLAAFVAFATPAAADRVRVEIDKYTLLELKADADSVFVGNPAVADVVVQGPRRLFVLGLTPGETSLRVLDIDGRDIIVTSIVVVPIEQRSVTVNRNTPQRGAVELTYSCDPRCALVRTPTAEDVVATAIGGAPAEDEGADEGTTEPLIPAEE